MKKNDSNVDFDTRLDNNKKTLRDCFEDMLVDLWYSRDNISEVGDWRSDYVRESFIEEFGAAAWNNNNQDD